MAVEVQRLAVDDSRRPSKLQWHPELPRASAVALHRPRAFPSPEVRDSSTTVPPARRRHHCLVAAVRIEHGPLDFNQRQRTPLLDITLTGWPHTSVI